MPVAGGSFRDPSGFVFTSGDTLYRQVNRAFAEEFDACTSSGLYDELTSAGLLVPHRRVDRDLGPGPDAHAVIEPERIPFISYPYEWSFGQLKDAALLTLDIQQRALARGFVLRDASAYNVQFRHGRPIFIDTLSFERYRGGEAWKAYKQFCEHFLVPLLLMAQRDVRCGLLMRDLLDGIPLDLGSALLPWRTRLSPRVLVHVHWHARAQRRYAEANVAAVTRGRGLTKRQLLTYATDLTIMVDGLDWRPAGTEWAEYVSETNYSAAAAAAKRELVRGFLEGVDAAVVWDLGANTGEYSRVARALAPLVVAFDVDAAAVERNWRQVKAMREAGILPLLLDITNPSPALGWAHSERMSLAERGPADAVLALALVHHLAIARNVPFEHIARFFATLGRVLVIEFVAKTDAQVQRLLRNRPDIFPGYTKEGFELAFAEHYTIARCERVGDAERWLYLMIARER